MGAGFYNTTSLEGDALKVARRKAKNQDEIILGVFKKHYKYKLTPFDVNEALQGMLINYPITSIRRSINTLTKSGNLVKSEKAIRKCIYAAPNHVWQLKS